MNINTKIKSILLVAFMLFVSFIFLNVDTDNYIVKVDNNSETSEIEKHEPNKTDNAYKIEEEMNRRLKELRDRRKDINNQLMTYDKKTEIRTYEIIDEMPEGAKELEAELRKLQNSTKNNQLD